MRERHFSSEEANRYLRGVSPATAATEVELHAVECLECSELLRLEARVELASSALARASSRPRHSTRRAWVIGLAAAAAMLIVAVSAAWVRAPAAAAGSASARARMTPEALRIADQVVTCLSGATTAGCDPRASEVSASEEKAELQR